MDTNPGRGEQVIDHYLPGAVTNYERKKYRKKKRKLHENLIEEFCETEESRFLENLIPNLNSPAQSVTQKSEGNFARSRRATSAR